MGSQSDSGDDEDQEDMYNEYDFDSEDEISDDEIDPYSLPIYFKFYSDQLT